MSDCTAKMHQVRFRLRLHPRPRWGSLQCSARPVAGFKGATSKGGEGRNSELFHWSLLKNTVVIVVTLYMSIAVRNNMHFVLYRYCCEGEYCVNIHLKCLEKSGKSLWFWSASGANANTWNLVICKITVRLHALPVRNICCFSVVVKFELLTGNSRMHVHQKRSMHFMQLLH